MIRARLALVAPVAVLVLAFGGRLASAQQQSVSTLVVDETTITINVPIDVLGGSEALIARWQQGIDRAWNAGNDGTPFRACGRAVRFNAQFAVRDRGETLSPQSHVVVVEPVKPGQVFVSRVWHALGTSPAYSARTGFWGADTDGAIAAHEFGHLLGLLDEYVEGETGMRAPGERPVPDVRRFPDAPLSLMADEKGSVLYRHVREIIRMHGGQNALDCRRSQR